MGRQGIDVGLVGELAGIEPPHVGEGRVEQLEAPVGAEDRHGLLQGVQGLALDADHGVEPGLEVVPLRDIVEEVDDAALEVGVGHDAQGTAVRQVPDGFAGLDRLVAGHQAGLPGAVVGLLGQAALGAQPVEDLAVRRPRLEEGGIEAPKGRIGGVVEDQPFGPVEDRHGGGELVQRAGLRVELLGEVVAQRVDLGEVRGDAGRADAARHLDDVERVAPARHDGADAAPVGFAGGAGGRRRVARGSVEQFEAAGHRLGPVAGLDRVGIGGVDPGHAAVGVAQPGRAGQGVVQGPPQVVLGQDGGMVVAEP